MVKKREIKNILYSFFSQIIMLLLGFLVPRFIISGYGSDTNGLTNTITQVFTYLALLEAGIAQATSNALYKFINNKNKNEDNISKIFSISQKYFRKVSFFYALVVLFVSIVFPLIIKTSLSYTTIFLYIIIEGIISLISFYFIQSWTALFQVDGRYYVVSKIELLNKVLCYGIKIVLAIKGINIIFIQLGCLVASLIKLLIYKIYIKKNYSWVTIEKNISGENLDNKSYYVVSEVAWTVFSSTDMIILSIFCSTQLASVYSIYNMVYLALNSLLVSVYNSMRYVLGQNYFTNTNKYKKIHDTFNSIFFGIMTIMMCVAYVLIIPFVRLYTSGVNDVNYIYDSLPLLFCLVQLISWSRYVSGNLTAIAGYAKNTSYVSVIEAIVNIVLSLILVNKYGIIGVLIATVVALPIKVVYCTYLADVIILKRSVLKTIKIIGCNWLIFIATTLIPYKIHVNSIISLGIKGAILTIIYSTIVIILNIIINKDLIDFVKNKLILKRTKEDTA